MAGTYSVTIEAQVTHFTDYTMTTTTTVTKQVSFNINMIDPCLSTVLQSLTISDMTRSVMQVGLDQTVYETTDSVSSTLGDATGLTYCGSRTIEIVTDPTTYSGFLSFDPATGIINLQTDDDSNINSYSIDARIYLDDYNSVEAFTTF